MTKFNSYKTTTALFLSLTLASSATIPLTTSLVNPPMVMAQNRQFNDVSNSYWAYPFINELVQRNVIAGFPDGTFRPDAPVTRAQFAAMVQSALSKAMSRSPIRFNDVPSNYWANNAINNAYGMGFLSGYPGGVFRPEQNIPREQVLVSLANGLNRTPRGNVEVILGSFNDSNNISNFARSPVAAATENQMVVNYPNLRQLNPNRNATRAEVAAFIYQALASQGQVTAINSPYVVGSSPVVNNPNVNNSISIPSGTQIPLMYDGADKILLTRSEVLPLTLTVSQNMVNSNNRVVIPRGSTVTGELRPFNNGTRFVAQTITLPNGQSYNISATSQVITETETITRGANVGNILTNAALGTAAAAAITAITGDRAIATEELLIGAGVGVLATLIPQFLGLNRVELLVVRPATNLNLALDQNLILN